MPVFICVCMCVYVYVYIYFSCLHCLQLILSALGVNKCKRTRFFKVYLIGLHRFKCKQSQKTAFFRRNTL